MVDSDHNKIYVANSDSNTASVIDGNNDTEIRQINVGKSPEYMVLLTSKIYVANLRSDTVSVINAANYKERNDIPLGNQTQASYGPMHIA